MVCTDNKTNLNSKFIAKYIHIHTKGLECFNITFLADRFLDSSTSRFRGCETRFVLGYLFKWNIVCSFPCGICVANP